MSGLMADIIKGIGLIIRCMEKECLPLKMEGSIQESMLKIKKKGMVCLNGRILLKNSC